MSLDHDHFMGICLELSRQAAEQGNRPLRSLIMGKSDEIAALADKLRGSSL